MSSKMLKSLAVVSVLTVGGAFVAHQAFAAETSPQGYGRYNQECGQMMGKGHGKRGGPGMHGGRHDGMQGGMGMGMMHSFDPDRVLTEGQVRIMSQAGLIKFGNENLKVGDIAKLKNGNYEVKIVTKDNSLVDTVEVDKASGMPTFLKDRMMKKHGLKGPKGKMGKRNSDRTFTKDEVETLAEARLIKFGNENIKLDGVAELKNGNYQVVIVTVDGSLVDKVEIDKATGKPVKMLKAMEARMGQMGKGQMQR